MKKILHVIGSLKIGGAERLLVEILPKMKRKYEVSLLVIGFGNKDFMNQISSNGIEIIELKQKNLYNPLVIFYLLRYSKEFDILHVHLFPSLYWVSLIKCFLRSKLIYTEHNTNNKRREKWYFRLFEKYIYSKYDKIISISRQTQSNLMEWLKEKDDSRFIIINNGIDLNRFSPQKNAEISKTDFNKKQTILMISRFTKQKDQSTVIKAFALLNRNELELCFVGDGPELHNCKNLAKNLDILDRVCFLGSRMDIPNLISDSFCGIQSSHWEGFGLTAIEFMASGKPIIASNVDGLRQIVEDAGIIFEAGNEYELANCINTLSDESYYKKVAKACLQRSKEYDIDTMVEKYLEVYHELLS